MAGGVERARSAHSVARSQCRCLVIIYTRARAHARSLYRISPTHAHTHTYTQIRLKILREDRDADGNVVDDVGYEFWSTIVRAPVDESPNPQRMPKGPMNTLEGLQRVELAASDVVSCPAHTTNRPARWHQHGV
jgi:hypothetical protein